MIWSLFSLTVINIILFINIYYEQGNNNANKTSVWGFSSVGRAVALHASGREFESHSLHVKRY